jgi:excisionase family DNA binding protein
MGGAKSAKSGGRTGRQITITITPGAVMSLPRHDIITLAELCAYWRVSETTLRREMERGELDGFKVGGQVRFHRKDVLAYQRDHTWRQMNLFDAEFS